MIELRCSRDLALKLGAVIPETIVHHKQLRAMGHLQVRDVITSWPLFWPWAVNVAKEIASRSSD